MDRKEILALLHIESPDEASDAIEMELFEIRKSILAKPLLRLTLKSKLARLKLLADIAAEQNLFQDQQMASFTYSFQSTDEVLGLWESYMKAKSQWKIVVTQTESPAALAVVLEEGLRMEAFFSEQFSSAIWTDEDPVFGVEPDPMLIQNGLKQAAQKGWLTFADLEKNKSELEKGFLLALKRLSLLPKYLH